MHRENCPISKKKENFFKLMKGIYEKSIANIIVDLERLSILLLQQRRSQGFPLLPCLLNIVLEILSQ